MSDLGTWRELRRADRLADREQDRADKAAASAAQREARRLEREQDREDRAAARDDKRQNKAGRTARRRERRAWVVDNGALICTGVVMGCAIVPALSAQFVALSRAGLGSLLAALLAAMLEGGAWAATFGAAKAARLGHPTGRYRAATWGCAVVAAAVNFWHGRSDYGLWLGIVLATASVFAVGMWELHLHGAHAPSCEERDQARHARRRRRHHRKVCRTADRLITAAPFGTLAVEEAFAAAWRVRHGTAPGLTAALLADRLAAESGLGKVVESAAETGPQRVTARLWTTADHGLPVLGPVCPAPTLTARTGGRSDGQRSGVDLQESTPTPADRSDPHTGGTGPTVPDSPTAVGGRPPRETGAAHSRRSTGPVPAAAKPGWPPRALDDLLIEARELTLTDDEISAERIRTGLRIGAARARQVRDLLQNERQEIAAQFQADEGDRRQGLHLVTGDEPAPETAVHEDFVPTGADR
ncbi:hypothetical protein ABZ769_32030 [Streptomyces olivoreticuli]